MIKKGRPRAYNSEEALNKIMDIFWRKGFTATSLDDIATETQMNKPSLYAAFGNKQALYDKAVERFGVIAKSQYQQALDSQDTNTLLITKIKRYFETAISLYTSEQGKLGCMVLSTAVAEADSPAMQAKIMQVIDQQQLQVINCLKQSTDELLPDADLTVMSKIITAFIHSISLRARAGESTTELQIMVNAGISAIKPYLR